MAVVVDILAGWSVLSVVAGTVVGRVLKSFGEFYGESVSNP